MPIGGEWRRGKLRPLQNHDPYTGEVILEIPQADRNDLDAAYASGSTRLKANLEWASVHRKPVGVVRVISPCSWPLHLSARSVGPALAIGNAVVLKPASDTPVTGGPLLAKIFEEAGLPPGLLNVIVGPGEEIGEARNSGSTLSYCAMKF